MRRNPPSTIYRYLDQPSTQIIQTRNTHRHNTTLPSQILAQGARPLSLNTIHTTATKTQTHILLSPCSSRIGKAQTQSCHPLTPNTSHPDPNTYTCHTLHQHLSPHSSLTRHQHYPKHLNHVYHPYTHSPHPHLPRIPRQHCRHPSSLAANTHATQTTVHASQSLQQAHPQHRVPRQPHRQTEDYHVTTNTTQAHIPSSKSERNLIILQVNINGIKNKLEELKLLIHDTHADIITIQETSSPLKPKHAKYITSHQAGGGLITLIRDNITFTTTDIPSTINAHNTELQMVKVHINNTKHITIANMYIPPRDSTSTH